MTSKNVLLYICGAAFLILLFAVPLFTQEIYTFHILCLIGINVIFASSLNMILSVGELNLAHATFMGLGAYSSTLLVMKLHLSFWFALPIAMIVAGAISLPVGYLAFRFKGGYFILLTFLFAELVRILLSNFWVRIFGGIPGLTKIPHPSIHIGNLFRVDFSSKIHFYYLILILTLLTVFVLRRINQSRMGMVFKAISQSDVLAESIGISSMKFKILGCVIGCFFAGMAGSLYAHFVGIITPPDFSIHSVFVPIAYVVIGGIGNVLGPIIGTVFLMMLSHFFLRQFGLYELLIYGVIIVLIIRFMPEGLISLPRRLKMWLGQTEERA